MKTKHKHYAVLTASTLGLTGLSFASGFGDEKYIYDASGNIVEKHLGDQVTRYDYAGNQLRGSISDQGKEQYQYDDSGRLRGEMRDGKPTRNMEHQYLDKVTKVQNGDKTTEFFYNAEGLLVAKSDQKGALSTYAWDGISLSAMNDGAFVIEEGIEGGRPSICSKTGEIVISDHLGTTLQKGTKVFSQTAYGEGLDDAWFTGKPYIAELRGYAFKHRNYSATEARWFSSDPAGFPDGTNSFAYLNDPNSGVDPQGTTVKLYVGGVQKSSHYVSSDGDNDNWGDINWSYTWSWSMYYPNRVHGTDGGLDFYNYGAGMKFPMLSSINNTVDLNMSVYEDSSGDLDYSSTGVDHFNTSPIVAGVAVHVTGVGTKTLRAVANGSVGHNGTAISGFGISATGGSVSITGTSDTVSYQ